MSRQPSTPPPMEDEAYNPFFQTPHKGSSGSNTGNVTIINSHSIKSKKYEKNHTMLFTPQTPCVQGSEEDFPCSLLPMSPQTTTHKSHATLDVFNTKKNSMNPLRTPETTPRYRKWEVSDSALEGSSLLPFTPGPRKREGLLECRARYNEEHKIEPKKLLDFGKSSLMKCEDYSNKEDELMNYNSSEYESEEDSQTKLLQEKLKIQLDCNEDPTKDPQTPRHQIGSDDIIRRLGEEKLKFPELNKVDDIVVHKSIKNPFIVDKVGKKTTNRKIRTDHNSRFDKELELVYHSTGEKFYVQLSEEAQRIKPKKLSFSEFKRVSDKFDPTVVSTPVEEIDFLQTPQRGNKMSIKGLLNYDGSTDADTEESEDEVPKGVNHEKIANPFRGEFSSCHEFPIEKFSDYLHVQRHEGRDKYIAGEIEYVNHHTGEHKVEKLSRDVSPIRPRKLNFDN